MNYQLDRERFREAYYLARGREPEETEYQYAERKLLFYYDIWDMGNHGIAFEEAMPAKAVEQ